MHSPSFRPRVTLVPLLLLLGTGCASTGRSATNASAQAPAGEEVPEQRMEGPHAYVLADDVRVQRIAPGVWLHTTQGEVSGHAIPANGLVVEAGEESVLVDAGWTPRQTDILLDWARDTLNRPVKAAVVTHFHEDRVGGVPALRARSVTVEGLDRTAKLAAEHQAPGPSKTFSEEAKLGPLTLYYPGAGHSRDNIVVWHEAGAVLFGGCFIKDAAATDLGNVADADLAAWPASLEVARKRFSAARIVVPGHGLPGGPELLNHTQELLNAVPRASAP